MDEGPGYEDVCEAKESGPTRAQADHQQNGANEIREEGDEKRGMKADADGIGKMGHELRPMSWLLFPFVAQEQDRSRAHA
jgi:hypothetical protein